MIYVPSFMKTDRDIQLTLRFCLSHRSGYNVGITDGRDL
jgi:hypothetical protein